MIKYVISKDGHKESIQDFATEAKAREYMERFKVNYEGCEVTPVEIPSMKLGEFVKGYSGDIDVYDDYDESLGIAFCGGDVTLTDEGWEHFADVMGLDVEVYDSCAVVNVGDLIDPDHDPDEDPDPPVFAMVKKLFYTLAGYCAEENYDKYVKEIW